MPLGLRLGAFEQYRPRQVECHASPRPDQGEGLPGIRVVTPSLNQGRFLAGAIRSVLDQGYPNLEYVVRDGGSDDESVAVLRACGDGLTAWVSEPDGGQAAAINAGFTQCRGEIMGWLNADDRLLPGSLLRVGRFFRENPDIDVVYGHRLVLDADGLVVGHWQLPPHSRRAYLWRDYVPQETMFWRSSIWERAGGRIDESFDFAIDWDLLLRFDQAGARFWRMPHYLGAFTTHQDQKSLAQRASVGVPEFRRLQRRVAPTPGRRFRARVGSMVYMAESAVRSWGTGADGPAWAPEAKTAR